jgi:hypothetical protein
MIATALHHDTPDPLIPPFPGEVTGPLTVAAYRGIADHAGGPRRVEQLTQTVARGVAHIDRGQHLRFGEVTVRDWADVRRMRRRVYEESLPALLAELDDHDQDRYDAHSFVFAAWLDGEPVATVRCTTFPFETLRYVTSDALGGYLGADWERDYIEWGRMAMSRAHRGRRLMPALITYAGIRLLTETPYHKYLGYTRAHVRARLGGFRIDPDSLTFRIPDRGDHEYALLRGDAWRDLVFAVPRFVRNTIHAIAGVRPRPCGRAPADTSRGATP